ncbi:MAG: hypothetical protein DRQ88_06890 [Epsilonproteobacteria bacterium]|nr:MAG: hypothetical protein DRQ89_05700 [Campylobacterota bacterium]RLA66361.1 MAG: hypothetical protein DRQ88_06890 [Campylobacterota bacterium]
MESVQTFYQELSPILEKHRDKLEDLVQGTQTSKVTVWRWLNGINSKHPDPNKLLSVLSKVSGRNKIQEVALFFGGEIKEFLENSFSHSFKNELFIDPELKEFDESVINDFYSYIVFSLCGTEAGSTEEEIISTLGNIVIKKADIPDELINDELIYSHGVFGKKKINDLINAHIIELKENGRYSRTKKNIRLDPDFSTKYLAEIIPTFLKTEEAHLGMNSFYGYQETIPVSIAQELAADTTEFFIKCYEKMNKYKTEDGIPYQLMAFGERLSFKKINDSIKREVQ